jgi:hypothetical protein
LLQVRSIGIPCYIVQHSNENQDFRRFQNGSTHVTQPKGNPKTNRRRVSDLGAPPNSRTPNKNPSPQASGISSHTNPIRVDQPHAKPAPIGTRDPSSVSPSVSSPHSKSPHSTSPHSTISNATIPPAILPSRSDYQRNLAELLSRPNTEWARRDLWQESIGQTVLVASKAMDSRNFQRVAKQDLERMAEAYDSKFFKGLCLPLARSYGMSFRLSSRMTRAGGKTTRTVFRGTRTKPSRTHFEIALSTSLLFQSFRKPGDSIRVCGHDCEDRLTAMQRIVEHEMIHLSEMLAWLQSDCSAGRFQAIARNMFGHTEHRHELITQQERAAKEFNIRAGTRVAFPYEGTVLQGIVNRITRRATILVEDLRGVRYSNGKRYLKYYVPIHQLRPID